MAVRKAVPSGLVFTVRSSLPSVPNRTRLA